MSRRSLLRLPALLVLPLVCAIHSAGPAAADEPARSAQTTLEGLAGVRLLDLSGAERGLAEVAGEGPVLLAWTGVGCPIAQKYSPRLDRLAARFGERGVRFVVIDACPQDTRAAISTERAELGSKLVVYKDFRQELTRALGISTTTEVVLFDATGKLRYRGAIDDQYALGAGKPEPTEDYLEDALTAVLAGAAPEPAMTAAPGCKITLLDESELPEAVTYSKHIAPILQRNCEACHRPGQVGPFALQSYEKAKGWAEMILEVVDEGRMPPWKASEEFDGLFQNERRLSGAEKALLHRWVADGMPRGNPDEDPAPIEWSDDWSIGEPDAVFAMSRWWRRQGKALPADGYKVPREGVVDYKYFAVETDFPEDRWVQALEARPGAADVVHHVLVMIDDPSARPGERERQLDFTSYFAAAVPGDASVVYPDGYGKRLPAGATLVFQMHYTPNGKQRFDRSSVALRFCEEPPMFEVVTDAILNNEFSIPPGAEAHEVRASRTFTKDTAVLGYFPHMHMRGKDFRYTLHYPDGGQEDLLYSNYDFNWQEGYVYYDPFLIPEGSRVECVGHFDNSESNPNNPAPDERVQWGDQSFEEMFIGYFDYVRPIE